MISEMEVEVSATGPGAERTRCTTCTTPRRARRSVRFYQQRFKDVTRRLEELASQGEARELDAERIRVKRTVERIRGQMRSIDANVDELERAIDANSPLLGLAHERSRRPSSSATRSRIRVSRTSACRTRRLLNAPALPQRRDRMPHEQYSDSYREDVSFSAEALLGGLLVFALVFFFLSDSASSPSRLLLLLGCLFSFSAAFLLSRRASFPSRPPSFPSAAFFSFSASSCSLRALSTIAVCPARTEAEAGRVVTVLHVVRGRAYSQLHR